MVLMKCKAFIIGNLRCIIEVSLSLEIGFTWNRIRTRTPKMLIFLLFFIQMKRYCLWQSHHRGKKKKAVFLCYYWLFNSYICHWYMWHESKKCIHNIRLSKYTLRRTNPSRDFSLICICRLVRSINVCTAKLYNSIMLLGGRRWESLRWCHVLYSKIQQSFVFKYLVRRGKVCPVILRTFSKCLFR